jgi:hypothetical protein
VSLSFAKAPTSRGVHTPQSGSGLGEGLVGEVLVVELVGLVGGLARDTGSDDANTSATAGSSSTNSGSWAVAVTFLARLQATRPQTRTWPIQV